MNADEKVSPCVKRWLENFSLFNMKLVHKPGKLIPADPLSRLTNLPSAVGPDLNSSVDFEPRYPLPYPFDKIDKVLFLESADKERLVDRAFSVTAPSPPSQAESAQSSRQSWATSSSTGSGMKGTFNHLEPHFTYSPEIKVKCIFDETGEGVDQSCGSQECTIFYMLNSHMWILPILTIIPTCM